MNFKKWKCGGKSENHKLTSCAYTEIQMILINFTHKALKQSKRALKGIRNIILNLTNDSHETLLSGSFATKYNG